MLNQQRINPANSDLVRAFPTARRDDALKSVAALPETSQFAYCFSAQIGDETVWIPYRIYHAPSSIDSGRLTRIQNEWLACLMTRHYNGLVREKYLLRIVDCRHACIAT